MNSLNRFRFSLSCRGGCGSVTLYDGSATPASLSQRNAFPYRFILPFSSIRFRKNRLFLSSNCEAILSKIALIFIFSVLSEYFDISCLYNSRISLYNIRHSPHNNIGCKQLQQSFMHHLWNRFMFFITGL